MSSPDDSNFQSMLTSKGFLPEAPFLEKDLAYVVDNNGGDEYSRNQVEFDTTSQSNNSKWTDFKNGYMSIPVVTVLTRSAGAVTEADGVNLLRFKSGNHTFVDSVAINYGGTSVVQEQPNVNAYFSFKQHSTFSVNDTVLNTHTGYRKDSSNWNYTSNSGLTNNNKDLLGQPFTHHTGGKEMVLSNANVKASGENCYQMVAGGLIHVYYYDCIIRLKDLLFFQNMDPIKGASIRITVKLNQSETTISNVGGSITSVNSLRGLSNFALRTSESPIGAGANETISVKAVTNGGYKHVKRQCRLYLPNYIMNPDAEIEYLGIGTKKIMYEDLSMKLVKVAAGGNFDALLTNSQSRMRRLIIVPMLSKHTIPAVAAVAEVRNAAGDVVTPAVAAVPAINHASPQESCFSSEPSTCSANFINNFKVLLSGSNLKKEAYEFKYEDYLNEMNGSYSVNSNLHTGVSASLIDMASFNSNMGFLIINLNRKYEHDEMVPMSLQIKGTNAGLKDLDLLCYIEYSKDLTIDLATGGRLE